MNVHVGQVELQIYQVYLNILINYVITFIKLKLIWRCKYY